MKKCARLTALALILSLLLTACGGGVSAATMHLRKTQGTVDIFDQKGKEITPQENLGLYSGYQLGTQVESYAWIDLDSVKLAKMDAGSEVEIVKEDKRLEIEVKSGSLFFNVTEPLSDDETMDIRTSTMMIGIRGTCGWVEVPDRDTMKVFLLEGKVRCETDGDQETIQAGEMAVLTESGRVMVSTFSAEEIPAFVQEEVEDQVGLPEDIPDTPQFDWPEDIPDMPQVDWPEVNPLAGYEELLGTMENVVYAEVIDFEGDFSPELLVIALDFEQTTLADVGMGEISIWRNGPDGPTCVMSAESNMNASGRYSLVEAGGRLLVRRYSESGFFGSYVDEYYSSVAQSDGVRGDWGMVDFQVSYGGGSFARVRPLAGNKFVENAGGFEGNDVSDEDVQGSYAPMRDLVMYDGANVTVAEPQ